MRVSIRARHCWRAMPSLLCWPRLTEAVSIRARHCWRAMRTFLACASPCFLFQSAPAIAGGRCINSFARCWVVAVSIRARHCWRAMPSSIGTISASINCFNPRPPLLAGDAHQVVERWLACHPVSIRARHCWRAMPAREQEMEIGPYSVSIRARHCWRAMPLANITKAIEQAEFQSAPAIAGGRCPDGGLPGLSPYGVSIRARHCWRAMPC